MGSKQLHEWCGRGGYCDVGRKKMCRVALPDLRAKSISDERVETEAQTHLASS